MARVRRVENREELDRLVEDFLTRGYKVKSEGQNSTMLKKKTWGAGSMHVVIALLTLWWTLGIGNIIYAVYKNRTAEEVQVKIDR